MSRVMTIARRELGSYFASPMAYVVMGVFLLACGFLFWDDFQPGQIAAMRNLFDWMVWMLVWTVPMLSMGLLAQEWATGTMETLMTVPLNEVEVVLGKFAGSFAFFLVLLSPTLLYVVLLAAFADPGIDLGPIASGYLGIVLVGAMFTAVGLFCSSLTRSQVVSAVSAAAVLFVVGQRQSAVQHVDRRHQPDGIQALRRFQPRRHRQRQSGFFRGDDGGVFVSERQGSGIAAVEMRKLHGRK